MKRVIPLFVWILFLCLVGCSSKPQMEIQETQPVTQTPEEPAGFVEMDIDPLYLQNAYSICTKDDLAVFLTSIYTDKDGNAYMPSGEDDFEGSSVTDYLVRYDLKNNRMMDMTDVGDCPVKEIWGIELEEDHIIIYSDSKKKNAVYDMDLNLVQVTDRSVEDPLDLARRSPFYDESRSSTNPGYNSMDGNDTIQYTYFLNDLNTLYVYHMDLPRHISCYDQDSDLFLTECFDDDGSKNLDFRIEDIKNAREINRASIQAGDYGFDYGSTGQTGLGNKYAICLEYFNSENSEDYMIRMFSWNYRLDPGDRALDIEKLSTLDSLSDKLIRDMKEDYGIEIHINEVHENIRENVSCKEKPGQVLLYDGLKTLKDFMDSLPEGMVKEVYSGYENDKEYGIRIDLVSEITYDAGAFAQSFTDPMEICFPFNNVNTITIAHEFMHLMDERIMALVPDAFENWDDFNRDFEREYDPDEENHPMYEFDPDHFLTEYSATSGTEERAELFSYLYCKGKTKDQPKLVRDKINYLKELIKEAYPSAKKASSLSWDS